MKTSADELGPGKDVTWKISKPLVCDCVLISNLKLQSPEQLAKFFKIEDQIVAHKFNEIVEDLAKSLNENAKKNNDALKALQENSIVIADAIRSSTLRVLNTPHQNNGEKNEKEEKEDQKSQIKKKTKKATRKLRKRPAKDT